MVQLMPLTTQNDFIPFQCRLTQVFLEKAIVVVVVGVVIKFLL